MVKGLWLHLPKPRSTAPRQTAVQLYQTLDSMGVEGGGVIHSRSIAAGLQYFRLDALRPHGMLERVVQDLRLAEAAD